MKNKHWTENPEIKFKCEKCGKEWKLKESEICPNCEKQEKRE